MEKVKRHDSVLHCQVMVEMYKSRRKILRGDDRRLKKEL